MPKIVKLTESGMQRITRILKFMASISPSVSIKALKNYQSLSKKVLDDIKSEKITEQPYRRLVANKGLYFVVVKKTKRASFDFADTRPRLPIFRSIKEAAVSMERNGLTKEMGYGILPVDVLLVRTRFSPISIAKSKKIHGDEGASLLIDESEY